MPEPTARDTTPPTIPSLGGGIGRERGRRGVTPRRAWQTGEVTEVRRQTPTSKTLRLRLPDWVPHLPGQHYTVRLTAPDGYTAQRSYSLVSSPNRTALVFFL